jgi:hypothetical protein
MSKKPVDRRPAEKPTRPGDGANAPSNSEPGRMAEDLQERKGLDKLEGRPIDKPFPTPRTGGKGKDFFEGERSDRESGRPVQLEDDEDGERSDQASGGPVQLEADEGRFEQRKGREDRTVREVEPTQR